MYTCHPGWHHTVLVQLAYWPQFEDGCGALSSCQYICQSKKNRQPRLAVLCGNDKLLCYLVKQMVEIGNGKLLT